MFGYATVVRGKSNRGLYLRLGGWLLFLAIFLFLYASRPNFFEGQLQTAASESVLVAYALYLLLGSVRGFTLIPSATLVFAAIPLFPPLPLFVLTLLGILVSSASVYYFSESLHLDEYFAKRNREGVERMKRTFHTNQLLIIIGWSFFPLAPTDLICYVCGILKVSFSKFLLGILIGEGTICGIYIFLGDKLLRFIHLRA